MPTIRLSSDTPSSVGERIALGIFLLVLLAGGLTLAYHGLFELLPAILPVDSWDDPIPLFWTALLIVFGSMFTITMILHAIRARAALDGTVLSVRGALRTRSADLAVAQVRGDTSPDGINYGRSYVHLIARMPGERPVTLSLGSFGKLLPPAQLIALADAVAAGDPADEVRGLVVDRLRRHAQLRLPPRYLWKDPSPWT